MASRSDTWRVGLLLLILAAAGCSSDVDIIGRCTLDDDPVLLELPMGIPSVAVVGERMFVSVTRSIGDGSEGFAGWVERDGRLASPEIDLGAGPYAAVFRTRWVRRPDGAVEGMTSFDPERDPLVSHEGSLRRWRVDATGVGVPQAVDLGIAAGGEWVPTLSALYNHTYEDSIWPSVDVGGSIYSALGETPSDRACGTAVMVFVIGSDASAVEIQTVDCTSGEARVRTATGAPTLFDSGDGTIGALVRMGAADDIRLRVIRFHPDGTLVAPPRLVGQGDAQGTAGGILARVARVPGNRLIVAERDGGENYCHMLTVMSRDGSESERAPWQPSCVGKSAYREGEARTTWVELVEVPGGAVFIWEEAPYVGLRLTDEDTWYERINAVLITPDGKRGSEIVTVTAPESTVVGPIGPYPGTSARHFVGHADSDRNHVAVAWSDLRADAPGLYARHLRCVVDPED